jgi:hypothetical protein
MEGVTQKAPITNISMCLMTQKETVFSQGRAKDTGMATSAIQWQKLKFIVLYYDLYKVLAIH